MKLLALVLLSLFVLPSDAANLSFVQDIAGHKLQRGREYYILPVIRGRSGGPALTQRNNTCPLYVTQESSEISNGLPLTFATVNPRAQVVPLSTDLNIEFSVVTICVQSTVWRLGDVDRATGRRYVSIGGVKGNPGLNTVSSWFKIERYGRDYKLVFCPSVCKFCKVVCGDLGVFVEDGKR